MVIANNDNFLTFSRLNEYVFVFQSIFTNSVPIYVEFISTHINNIYQFKYGPLDEHNNIDIYAVMRFGNVNQIILTITKIIYEFLQQHKCAILRFSGSTESRTRFFTRWIYLNWDYMQCTFIMYGYDNIKKWHKLKKSHRVEAVLLKININ